MPTSDRVVIVTGGKGEKGDDGDPGPAGASLHAALSDLATSGHPATIVAATGPAGWTTAQQALDGLHAMAVALTSADTAEISARNAAITTAIDELVGGAPGVLDTLAELAVALGDNDDAIAALLTAVAARATQVGLDAEEARALAVEGVLDDAIADEVTRATSAEHANAVAAGTYLKPAGVIASTLPRTATLSNVTGASGGLRGTIIWIDAGELITGIAYYSFTTAITAPTDQWFALYDDSYNLLRQTVNDLTNPWPINTRKPLDLTTPFTTLYSGWYQLVLVITGTTYGIVGSQSNVAVTGQAPITGFVAGSGLTDTAPATLTVTGSAAYMQYAEVY